MRLCAQPGCPTLYKGRDPRCPEHRRAKERARGSRQARGYDTRHDRLRAQWAPKVATGRVRCSRCHIRITPHEPWHLDHADDRSGYIGPSHEYCNTRAGGQAAHR